MSSMTMKYQLAHMQAKWTNTELKLPCKILDFI